MPEPKFVPAPGQVDYTAVRYAPVVNIVVMCGGKILLVRRSSEMRLYPNYWNGVSGFLDDNRSIEEKVAQELHEELGMDKARIESIERGQALVQEASEYHKTWLVVPVLVRVRQTKIALDWEAQDSKWFLPSEIRGLELLPGFDAVIGQFVKLG